MKTRIRPGGDAYRSAVRIMFWSGLFFSLLAPLVMALIGMWPGVRLMALLFFGILAGYWALSMPQLMLMSGSCLFLEEDRIGVRLIMQTRWINRRTLTSATMRTFGIGGWLLLEGEGASLRVPLGSFGREAQPPCCVNAGGPMPGSD